MREPLHTPECAAHKSVELQKNTLLIDLLIQEKKKNQQVFMSRFVQKYQIIGRVPATQF